MRDDGPKYAADIKKSLNVHSSINYKQEQSKKSRHALPCSQGTVLIKRSGKKTGCYNIGKKLKGPFLLTKINKTIFFIT
jgi:hypothetical protein